MRKRQTSRHERAATGDQRAVNQLLKIDLLPLEARDKIVQLRNAEGRTWEQIEELSADFVKWGVLPTHVLEQFPDMRLPHSTLHRWFDLRVEQVRKRNQEEAAFSREMAAAFREMGFQHLGESVRNALAKEIFLLSKSAQESDKATMRAELLNIGKLLAYERRTAIQKQRADAELKKVALLESQLKSRQRQLEKATEAAVTKLGKGQSLTIADVNRIRERTFGLPALGGADE